MSEFVIMPKEDWQNILDGIRNKSGTSELLTSGCVRTVIDGIQSGKELYLTHVSGGDAGEITAEMLDGIESIKNYAFYNRMITSVVIPDSITSIGGCAFHSCINLTDVVIGSNVLNIYISAFASCGSLKSVRFMGSCDMIQPTAFDLCNALTDIYVPWSEGAVANAPWGAVNATIHYDTEAM